MFLFVSLSKAKKTVTGKKTSTHLKGAGSPGLTPVKKTVVKNGKSFVQTFYIKTTVEAPKAKTKAPPKLKKPSAPKTVKQSKPVDDKSHMWNKPDGFYIPVDGKAIHIPDSHINTIVSYKGATFVIHNAVNFNDDATVTLLKKFKVSEKITGLGVSVQADTPKEAMKSAEEIMGHMTPEKIAETIEKQKKIGEYESVYGGILQEEKEARPSIAKTKDISREANSKDYNKAAGELVARYGESLHSSKQSVLEWIKDVEFTGSIDNLADLMDIVSSPRVLDYAIKKAMTYRASDVHLKILDEVQGMASSSKEFPDIFTLDNIDAWGKEHYNGFWEGHPFHSALKVGLAKMQAEDAAAYALKNNVGYYEAVDAINLILEERNIGLEKTLDWKDHAGHTWKVSDFKTMGRWVGGHVTPNRERAKEYFKNKMLRQVSLEDGEVSGVFIDPPDDPSRAVLEVMLEHLQDFPLTDTAEGTLYRGTKGSVWRNAVEGDVIPFGFASFTHSHEVGDGYASSALLVMKKSTVSTVDNPGGDQVRGVDLYRMMQETSEKAPVVRGVLESTYVTGFESEQEFIPMAPALRIEKRVQEPGKAYVTLYVSPYHMDLVPMVKAKLANDYERILAMEKTFNYTMHDEPEGL